MRLGTVLSVLAFTTTLALAQPKAVTLWVTLGDSDQLVEVDAYTFKEIRRNFQVVDAADGSRIYVGAQYGNAIAVFDPATQSLLHQIPTSDGVRPLEPTENGKIIYTALSYLVGFITVDPDSRSVTRRVELAQLPDGVPKPYLNTYTHALQLVTARCCS